MLSTTGSGSLTVAYPSTVGFDQATGLGSVNVATLIADWNTAFTSSTSLTADPSYIVASESTELTATVAAVGPTGYVGTLQTPTGPVIFKAGSTEVGNCTLSAGTCSTSVSGSSLLSGANSMTAIYAGSEVYPSSTSGIVTVNVVSPSTPTILVEAASSSITSLQPLQVTVIVYGGSGTPTGSVTLSGGGYTSAATTLSSGSAIINIPGGSLSVGSDSLTGTYTPNVPIYNTAISSAPVTVTLGPPPVSFGFTSEAAGASATQPVTFTMAAGTTVGSISVLTQGAPNLDFTQASGGTCTATTYSSDTNCTVEVSFAPRYAGLRMGAVVFKDGSGNLLSTTYLSGIGTGPQIAFGPPAETTLGGGFSGPTGVAVDGTGTSLSLITATGR